MRTTWTLLLLLLGTGLWACTAEKSEETNEGDAKTESSETGDAKGEEKEVAQASLPEIRFYTISDL